MVVLKSPDDIQKMREINAIVAEILELMRELAKPGVTTLELDRRAEDLARRRGGVPAFKGYGGFPFSLCASVNDEVVHGFPSERPLQDGDILGVDFGVHRDGFYGDAAVTIEIGTVSETARRLVRTTEEALQLAIEQARPGNRLGDISSAVQQHVEKAGFAPVRDYVGHGIGTKLHEEPSIPNFGSPGRGILLKPGMVFAIEPMINEGTFEVRVKQDGWTVVTSDGKLSAHFEHTVAVTEEGPRVLSTLA